MTHTHTSYLFSSLSSGYSGQGSATPEKGSRSGDVSPGSATPEKGSRSGDVSPEQKVTNFLVFSNKATLQVGRSIVLVINFDLF